MYTKSMTKRDEIIRLAQLETPRDEIATTVGVNRSYVQAVLSDAGMTRPYLVGDTRHIPASLSAQLTKRDRMQHAYKMLKALEKAESGEPLSEGVARKLDGWVKGLDKKVWTYRPDRGFYHVTRQPKHGDKPFVLNA